VNLNRMIHAALLLLTTSTFVRAQRPEPMVMFGGLRVPACSVSSDPEYGLVPAKPIQLGGGPAHAASRMARYIGSLRGPQGQTLQLSNTRGSLLAPAGYWDEPTILDSYRVSYDGQTVGLYVDAYHYSLPKAPAGFTCGGPLVTALGAPPLDPLKVNSSIAALAVEYGSAKREVTPISLGAAPPRGYLMDTFTLIALRARTAATSEASPDSNAPQVGPEPAGLIVLAYPVPCGNRMITPQDIEPHTNQGQVPRNGELIRDEAVGRMFSGVPTPGGSLAARFRQAPISQVRIRYAEACEGASNEVLLPIRIEPPRITTRPAAIPQGISEADPTVYLQVILDSEGRFVRPLHIGGPKSLVPAAIDSIGQWPAEPVRVNGTAVINPMVLQVVFQ